MKLISMLFLSCAFAPFIHSETQDAVILRPIVNGSIVPFSCHVGLIQDNSPAQHAGIQVGDEITLVNGEIVDGVDQFIDLISRSGPTAQLSVRHQGKDSSLSVPLNKKPNALLDGWVGKHPRLGAGCSVIDQVPVEVSSSSITLRAAASIIGGITYVRVRVRNDAPSPFNIGPELFFAADDQKLVMPRMNPQDVYTALHGNLGLQVAAAETSAATSNMAAANIQNNASYTTSSYGHATATRVGNYGYANAYGQSTTSPDVGSQLASSILTGMAMGQANRAQQALAEASSDAEYLTKASLKQTELESGYATEGVVYFGSPQTLPFSVWLRHGSTKISVMFANPQLYRNSSSATKIPANPG